MLFCVKNKIQEKYWTQCSIFGSENPDLGISSLKLKQEISSFFFLLFYSFRFINFSAWSF